MSSASPTGHIVLATTTFYKEEADLRYKLALDMAKMAQQAQFKLIIVDGSPKPEIANAFRELGAMVFKESHKGMGASRRQAYFEATQVLKSLGAQKNRIVVWLEPEKADLIRFIPTIVKPILEGDADVVIPHRTETSWKSYPEFQQKSEAEGNESVAKLSGRKDLDVFFGPVASTLSAANLVIESDPVHQGFADTYVPQYLSSMALQKKLTVVSIDVGFIYPEAQKREEEGNLGAAMIQKRQEQLATVVKAHNVILGCQNRLLTKQNTIPFVDDEKEQR